MTDLRSMSDEDLLRFIQQQRPTALEEIGPSAKTGAIKAVSGIAGLPGDIQTLTRMGLEKFAGRSLLPYEAPQQMPTSGMVQKEIENFTGPSYEPKTTVGKLTRTAVEFAPAAAMPAGAGASFARSIPQRLMNVVGPTIGAEAGEAVGGQTGRLAGSLLGGVMGSRGVTPAPATPEHMAMVRVLEGEGVPLTAGQRTGNKPMQWFEQAAGDTPITAGKVANMNDAQQRAFSGAVMRRIGATGNDIATPQAVDRAVTNLSNRFESIASRSTATADQQFVNDLLTTARNYVDSVIPTQRATGKQNIESIIRDVADVMQRNGGQMSGELYQATRSRLGKMAKGVEQSDPQLSEAISGIQNSLDDVMGRSIPVGDRMEWQLLRTQWKNWKALEKAMGGSGSAVAEGFVSPSQLRTAVAGQGRGQYARGKGDMAELARAGEAILKPLPNSGTPARLAATNLTGSIGGMLLGHAASGGDVAATMAGAAIPSVVGRSLLSKPAQAYLGNQLAPNTLAEMRRALIAEQLLARPQIQGPGQ